MKIIAKGENNKLILEASPNELAQLTGYRSWIARESEGEMALCVGDAIDVAILFDYMELMRTMLDPVERAKQILTDLCGGISLAEQRFNRAIVKCDSGEKVSA